MPDPICRWRNSSIKQAIEFSALFTGLPSDKQTARAVVDQRWGILGGSNFFTTPYQLAVQMGMYYEGETEFYPRFKRTLLIDEAVSYMGMWGRRYYAPNPYTKSMDQSQQPVIINNFLVNWCYDHEDAVLKDAISEMFTDEIGNSDIFINMINNFMDVSVDSEGKMHLKVGAPSQRFAETHLSVSATDKKAFFDTFNMYITNSNSGGNGHMNEPNIVYYGAPGTGKSHQLKEDIEGANYIRTIFHPDTDYSSFVGCYKPLDNGTRITYSYQPQAFVKAYVKAWLSQKPFYLVIEEINRGNCAQIFGDIFQLLDRKNGESEYEIEPDTDLQEYLRSEFAKPEHEQEIANNIIPEKILKGEIMKLPANLLIRATMNTSDQSLFPMDSAFKRRWSWRYFSIKDEGKKYVIKLSDDTEYDWWKTIEAINVKILNTTKSADKQIGYWFAKLPEGETTISADDFVSKVIFYLWTDVFKDYSFGDNNAFSSDLTFEKFYSSDGKVIEQAVKDFMNRNYPKEDAETTA